MTESDEELEDSTLLMDKSKAAAADTSSMDSSRRRSVHSISMLGNALSSEKLEPSAKVRIVWPKEKCKMLGQEVVIIDSPGIDVETDLDAWIDRVCLDSDVFVLVANSGEDRWQPFVHTFLVEPVPRFDECHERSSSIHIY